MTIQTEVVDSNEVRQVFSDAMSEMYRGEVPAYGLLLDVVADVNREWLERADPAGIPRVSPDYLRQLSAERHGAVRVGTAQELQLLRRAFALMGMHPVGYYNLGEAGMPIHSTAFRPVDEPSLNRNPFRIFTSLLRLDLIEDEALREEATAALERREILSKGQIALLERAEEEGGVRGCNLDAFILGLLDVFRWQSEAHVDRALYERLLKSHRLIADIVSFKGPHINHLTPRTLDIDTVQARMPACGILPKAIIEGPPKRACPILLRQTSFRALNEPVLFPDGDGGLVPGLHTARFGEIEQRGAALTPKGHGLYNQLLNQVRLQVTPLADGSNAEAYRTELEKTFRAFPDDWETLRKEGLVYFRYVRSHPASLTGDGDFESQVLSGAITYTPLVYEDFLPVSAAGIFQSNLGDDHPELFAGRSSQSSFEDALGTQVTDPFRMYARMEQVSRIQCMQIIEATAS